MPKSRQERIKYTQEWRASNPEYAERQRAYSQIRWRQRNPVSRMLDSSRQRAAKAGLEWALTPEDIVIPDVCPILGRPFEYKTPYAASLDRIDNTKGYIPGNIQVIGRRANTMKSAASPEELIKFAEWIFKEYASQ